MCTGTQVHYKHTLLGPAVSPYALSLHMPQPRTGPGVFHFSFFPKLENNCDISKQAHPRSKMLLSDMLTQDVLI